MDALCGEPTHWDVADVGQRGGCIQPDGSTISKWVPAPGTFCIKPSKNKLDWADEGQQMVVRTYRIHARECAVVGNGICLIQTMDSRIRGYRNGPYCSHRSAACGCVRKCFSKGYLYSHSAIDDAGEISSELRSAVQSMDRGYHVGGSFDSKEWTGNALSDRRVLSDLDDDTELAG